MGLFLLLDEQISPAVAEGVSLRRPDVRVVSLRAWYGGAFLGAPDDAVLRVAARDGLTLVTYDRKTITPLLVAWGAAGDDHAGVVFVDEESVRQRDIGAQVLALIGLWDRAHDWDWHDVVVSLTPVR